MYENALDWEHLPWLHQSSFSDIECIDAGDWGWRAKATLANTNPSQLPAKSLWHKALGKSLRHQPWQLLKFSSRLIAQSLAAKRGGKEVLLELRLDRERKRWITTTLAGVGAGTEIWTHVIEHDAEDIEVVVDFFVPNIPQPMAAPLGRYYQNLYHRLYDEDQEMMETRQQALDKVKSPQKKDSTTVSLGDIEELKAKLPITVSLAGRDWQLREHQNHIAVHATLCPHMLGPLDQGHTSAEGTVRCPWHGYEFSLATGENLSGQRCKLPKPPETKIENGQVTLVI
jgi:nitrite reductase/ring-hydroxylating ferredoxin subunit